jgi:hypothetical protein
MSYDAYTSGERFVRRREIGWIVQSIERQVNVIFWIVGMRLRYDQTCIISRHAPALTSVVANATTPIIPKTLEISLSNGVLVSPVLAIGDLPLAT